MGSDSRHIMVFEPRLAGHHLRWLQYITADLLDAGCQVTLAVDGRPALEDRYRLGLGELRHHVRQLSVVDSQGRPRNGSVLAAVADCFRESGADEVFMPNLDDIASNLWRRAAVGLFPPPILKGRLSGVYFRPRFLSPDHGGPGAWFKRTGFTRLVNRGWLRTLFFLDETLVQRHGHRWPNLRLRWLPDPWEGQFGMSGAEARLHLGIPPDVFVWLNYGLGHRRKGLHLAVAAMAAAPDQPWHLLCAGQIQTDQRLRSALDELMANGRATVLDHYVSEVEERQVFCAADAVLLPYVRHYGSSGVLSLAAAARRPVIAADYGLLAHRVATTGMGLTCTMNDAEALGQAMRELAAMPEAGRSKMAEAGAVHARDCNRSAFGEALRHGLLAPSVATMGESS